MPNLLRHVIAGDANELQDGVHIPRVIGRVLLGEDRYLENLHGSSCRNLDSRKKNSNKAYTTGRSALRVVSLVITTPIEVASVRGRRASRKRPTTTAVSLTCLLSGSDFTDSTEDSKARWKIHLLKSVKQAKWKQEHIYFPLYNLHLRVLSSIYSEKRAPKALINIVIEAEN